MSPLVLAIEPDLRQAAIVKRIVREKVLADVAVVDSRDAALEAIRTTMPDVLLLSTLLSPRDEDELIAHLRTLQHAEHLQTHTIPQLASAIASGGDAKPARGRLTSWLRRKDTGSAPAGCDPDLFAEEIRTYLQRASDKKRELRDTAHAQTMAPAMTTAVERPRPEDTAPSAGPDSGSSWSSPFEWRPSGNGSSPTAHAESAHHEPAPRASAYPESSSVESALLESAHAESSSVESAHAESAHAAHQNAQPATDEPVLRDAQPASHDPEPAFAEAQPVAYDAEPVYAEPVYADPPAAVHDERPAGGDTQPAAHDPRHASRAPLVVRHARGWWFEDRAPSADVPARELAAFLAALAVPEEVAAVAYAEGCRIRRVRTVAVVTA